jgi:hypothetical protein
MHGKAEIKEARAVSDSILVRRMLCDSMAWCISFLWFGTHQQIAATLTGRQCGQSSNQLNIGEGWFITLTYLILAIIEVAAAGTITQLKKIVNIQ